LYRSTHGDTLVPVAYSDNPQLGNWVDNQRQLYRMRLEAEDLGRTNETNKYPRERITDERIEKLNSIGLWKPYDHAWNIRYEELKEYMAEHGHSYVPQGYSPNAELGSWVNTQRRTYKVRQQGGSQYTMNDGVTRSEVIMSEDRQKKLEEIGFSWNVFEDVWFQRLEELKAYKMSNGDTLVPKIYPANKSLGRWVDKQRLDYKRYMDKKKVEEKWGGKEVLDNGIKDEIKRLQRLSTGMTEERIRLLEEEDFVWDVRDRTWELRFEEVCRFVALNGHGAVSERSPYTPLGGWAANQRRNYRIHQSGQRQTTLTEERIERLNAIGFAWELPRGGAGRATKHIPTEQEQPDTDTKSEI